MHLSMKPQFTVHFILSGSAILFLSLLSCKDNPVEPIKDPRTYTWTIDTLAYPGSFQTAMRDIWGSSPSNVYVVGHNDSPGDATMFRFDGRNWKTTGFHASAGGSVSGAVSLSAIYGFSANNIFAVGDRIYDNPKPPPNFLDSSLIIQFDGRQWREHAVSGGRFLAAVWGANPRDVWAAGIAGTLFHYDGTKWTKHRMSTDYIFSDLVGRSAEEVYLKGNRYEGPPGDYTRGYRVIFRFDGTSWRAIDSVDVASDLSYRIGMIGSTLYSIGYGLWAWRGGGWQKELTVSEAPLQSMYAVSASNVFVVGQQSLIYHYNGQTWQQLRGIIGPGWWLHAVWATEREVFIVGHDAGGFRTVILHGR
jgi:hypothetical protein